MKASIVSLALILVSFPVLAQERLGALATLQALPVKYQTGVYKVSADNAKPNPDTWYIVARGGEEDSPFHNITMAGGQVVSDKVTLGLRQLISGQSAISLGKVQVDSGAAYGIAERYAQANGKTLGGVSFALEQKGSDAAPIWSVWCYGVDGSYYGLMQLLATDGTVVSNDAFPNRP
jgi:hypothetical protein